MPKLLLSALLLSFLTACASQPPGNPYGSPDGQRERAEKATQELDRSAAQK